MKLYQLLSIVWFAIFPGAIFGQAGNPAISVYSPKSFAGNYTSSPQNVGIIQSGDGFIYFANPSGILEFDGNYWKMLEGTEGIVPRDFDKDSKGTIYVCGNYDMGYLRADSTRTLRFYSLLPYLEEPYSEPGIIYNVFAVEGEIYFLSRKQLMLYRKGEMKVWQDTLEFGKGYTVNNTLYVEQQARGLWRVKNGERELVLPAQQDLSLLEIMNYFKTLCPCNAGTENLIGKNAKDKFFLFDGTKNLVRLSDKISQFLSRQRGFKLAKDSLGNTAIGTYSGGVVVVNKQGEFLQLINKERGLPDNIVNALWFDNSDGLWIGHDNGISRTQLNSPLSFINPESGYTGIIVSITRFNDQLYISTTDGIYAEIQSEDLNNTIRFQRIQEIENQGFTLIKTKNSLLAASIMGVFEISGNHAKRIASGVTVDLFTSKTDTNLIFAAMSEGIVPLRYENGEWEMQAMLTGFNDIAYKSIDDENDVIWSSNANGKIYRINIANNNFANPLISEFDTSNGLPPGWVYPVQVNGNLYFESLEGVYEYDETHKKFALTTDGLFSYFNNRKIEAANIRADRFGTVWLSSGGKAGKLYRNNQGEYEWDSTATMAIPESPIWAIYLDNNDIVWIGTSDGLVRYDSRITRKKISNFPTYVRKITRSKDSSFLFSGIADVFSNVPKLHYKNNEISFEYAAPFFEGENVYSVKLEGNDYRWSPWSEEAKIRYTNLSPGDYTFKVKSKNIYGFEGKEARFSFTILPPFYLTVWAYLFYGIISVLVIWGVVRINSRRLKRSKKRLEGLVKERTIELSQKNEELKKAKEFEEQFLANMSHEIRTPMNSIVGITNLMLRSDLQEKQRKYLNAIRQSADHLLVIINDILDISKIQSGKLEIVEEDFNLEEAIAGVISVMKFSMDEKDLKVEVNIDPELPEYVSGDAVRLHEILLNLINNAVKFTERGGITIHCRIKEKTNPFIRVEFIVADTGIGIPEDRLSSLFISFNQGGREISKKFGGSGLGLAICKQLVEMQRGSIDVQSQVGIGTTFRFDILYVISHQKPQLHKQQEIIHALPEGLCVLLVENNEFNQMVAKDTLEAVIDGVKIEIVENGAEAVSRVAQKHYDIVLMDLLMPVMDGYEATKKIREELPAPAKNVKILAMTASSSKEERDRCFQTGMDDYLTKPFKAEELVEKIANLTGYFNPKTSENHLTADLKLLEKLVNGDKVKMGKYINLYLQSIPQLLDALDSAVKQKDWKEIRATSHSLIPQFQYLGTDSLSDAAREIEKKALAKKDIDYIRQKSQEIKAACKELLIELKNKAVALNA